MIFMFLPISRGGRGKKYKKNSLELCLFSHLIDNLGFYNGSDSKHIKNEDDAFEIHVYIFIVFKRSISFPYSHEL